MNKSKLMLTTFAAVVVAASTVGCYTQHDRERTIYEPAGSSRDYRYNRDRVYRDDNRYDRYRNDDYRDGRWNDRHQWDNPNYRR